MVGVVPIYLDFTLALKGHGPNGENWALGAFAGGGAGGFATNANSVGDLAGPFKTASLNVGAGEVSGSLDLSKGRNSAGNEITESSLTFGPGIGISAAQMNTNTVVIFSSRR